MNYRDILKLLRDKCPLKLYWERLSRQEVLEHELDRFKKWEVLRISFVWNGNESGYNLKIREVRKTVRA